MNDLMRLLESYPLPGSWSRPELYREDVSIGEVVVSLAGFVAKNSNGTEVTGSAAGVGAPPIDRALYELVERVAIVTSRAEEVTYSLYDESGNRVGTCPVQAAFPAGGEAAGWRYAMSSGVALHNTWAVACRHACWELVERDRLLRSWYGEVDPVRISRHSEELPEGLGRYYEFQTYSFDVEGGRDAVVAVFGFPKDAQAPLVFGSGAGNTIDEAGEHAARECLQRLGFLWQEPIPNDQPMPAPSPAFHQEFYLLPSSRRLIEQWLSGGHAAFHPALQAPDRQHGTMLFIDLTPACLNGRAFVAKALDSSAVHLTFGPGHPLAVGELPEPLRVHPFC